MKGDEGAYTCFARNDIGGVIQSEPAYVTLLGMWGNLTFLSVSIVPRKESYVFNPFTSLNENTTCLETITNLPVVLNLTMPRQHRPLQSCRRRVFLRFAHFNHSVNNWHCDIGSGLLCHWASCPHGIQTQKTKEG